MAKYQLIESQIDVALGMHEADASQCVIAEQLSISQSAISRLFRKIAITTLKLAVHVASTSVLLPIASLVALLDLLSNYVVSHFKISSMA